MPSKLTRKFFGGTSPGRRASTSYLADYNYSLELKLPENLTERLRGVTAQIFPLPADLNKMQRFLDCYLNCPDPLEPDGEGPPVYFKPAAPFVLLEVANYSRVSENVRNVGWFSQREIAFGMALEWYARKGDDIEFLRYALIYPYVYVDTELGILGGRGIYGWSKAPINVAVSRRPVKDGVPEPFAPVFDHPTDELLLEANRLVAKRERSVEVPSKLIEIRQSRYFQAAASALPDLLTAVPRAMIASISAAWDLTQFVWGSGSYATRQLVDLPKILPQFRDIATKYLPSWATQTSGYRASDSKLAGSPTSKPAGSLASKPAGSPTSIITLKQVREADSTVSGSAACYQAIVESTMRIECISDGGSLIDLTNPDPSAGIYIDLYGHYGQEPEMLELGIQSQELESDPKRQDRLFRVAPFLPFWVEMDLRYGPADYQAWRTDWTGWTQNNNPKRRDPDKRLQISYIELGAGAPLEIEKPTCFNARMRVFPIPALRSTINDLINRYLANNGYFTFTSAGAFPPGSVKDKNGNPIDAAVVVAILSDFEGMQPEGYGDYELTLAIPIRWTDNQQKASDTGLMHLYTFAGSYWNTITSAEVYGRDALRATFVSAPFSSILPPRLSNLALTVKSELFREADSSDPAEELPIVKVYELPSPPPNVPVASTISDLGLGHLVDGKPFYSIALKQIIDANDTDKADYQASVWLERTIPTSNPNFYHQELELHFFKYPLFKIPDLLGLICTNPGDEQCCVVKAINPFYLEGSMQAGETGIGWWRIGIGKEGWRGPVFKPKGSKP